MGQTRKRLERPRASEIRAEGEWEPTTTSRATQQRKLTQLLQLEAEAEAEAEARRVAAVIANSR